MQVEVTEATSSNMDTTNDDPLPLNEHTQTHTDSLYMDIEPNHNINNEDITQDIKQDHTQSIHKQQHDEVYRTLLNAVPTGSMPKKVLEALKVIKKDKWDVESWNVVLQHAQSIRIQHARPIFSSFLDVYPTSGRYWRYLIDQEMREKNYVACEDLFKQCLIRCMDVELWRLYLKYVKLAKQGDEDASQEMKNAFDFTLEHIGLDRNSSVIWKDYIEFLKSQPTNSPYEESQKIGVIRKIYQRAVTLPLSQLESLWKEYDVWEHSLNRDLAKEMLSKLQQQHINSKVARRERSQIYEGIVSHMLPRLPPKSIHAQIRDYKQVLLWKNALKFEKGNPQKLDAEQLKERIDFTYRKALLILRYYPEIWADYAQYYAETRNSKEASKIFDEACDVMPDNVLIHFIYANFEESHKNYADAKDVYEKLLDRNPTPLVYIQYMKFARRCESIVAARKIFLQALRSSECTCEVYVSGAQIEYQLNKEPQVAARIFNHGMKKHNTNITYLTKYLDFLDTLNDHDNMRVVLEQALNDLDEKDCGVIWDRYVNLQYAIGDLTSMQSIETRRAKALQSPENSIVDLINRYAFESLLPCSRSYLDTLRRLNSPKLILIITLEKCEKLRVSERGTIISSKVPVHQIVTPDLTKMSKIGEGGVIRDGEMMKRIPRGRVNLPPFALNNVLVDFLYKLPPPRGALIDIDKVLALVADTKMNVAEEAVKKLQLEKSKSEVSGKTEAKPFSRAHRPPPNDVFRRRQKTKKSKQS